MRIATFLTRALGRLSALTAIAIAGIFGVTFALFADRASADANTSDQVRLGELRALPGTALIVGKSGPQKLTIRDIAVDADGDVWIAAAQGLFVKRGLAWEHVPTVSTNAYVQGFSGARRIAFGDDGRMWVIAGNHDLLARRDDGTWLRVFSSAEDVAAGNGTVWVLIRSTESTRKLNYAGDIFRGRILDPEVLKKSPSLEDILETQSNGAASSAAKNPFWGSFFNWLGEEWGEATSVTVDEFGQAHFGTKTGRIMVYDGDRWFPKTTPCDVLEGRCAITDLAFGNGALWVTGAHRGNGFTRHFTEGRFSGIDDVFPKLAPQMRRLATNAEGDLYAVDMEQRAVAATLSYDYERSGGINDLLAAYVDIAQVRELTRFVRGRRKLTYDLSRDESRDLAAELTPGEDMTIAFTMAPGRGAEGPQCAVAIGSTLKDQVSVCFNKRFDQIIVKVGGEVKRFNSDFSTGRYLDGEVAVQVVVKIENSKLEVRTQTRNMTQEDVARINAVEDKELRRSLYEATFRQAVLPKSGKGEYLSRKSKATGALLPKLFIGSRNGERNPFHGSIGTVRIWGAAVNPNFIMFNPQNADVGRSNLPRVHDLLLEVPLTTSVTERMMEAVENRGVQFQLEVDPEREPPEADEKVRPGRFSIFFREPSKLAGDWVSDDNGEYYAPQITVGPNGQGTYGLRKVEVISIRTIECICSTLALSTFLHHHD